MINDHICPSLGIQENVFGQPVGKDLPGWKGCETIPQVALRGQVCTLAPYTPSHITELFAALTIDDGSMWTYMPFGPFQTAEDLRTSLESYRDTKGFQTYIINVDERPVGYASYMRHDLANGSVEVGGVTFSPALRRTRAATEAMYLMMKYAFDRGFRRYEWKCDQLNAPSNRAARRLGFQFEGIFRNAVVNKGLRRDTAWYAVIVEDWPEVRERLETWLDAGNFGAQGQQIQALPPR